MRVLLIKILVVILVIILIQEFWKQLKKRAYFGG